MPYPFPSAFTFAFIRFDALARFTLSFRDVQFYLGNPGYSYVSAVLPARPRMLPFRTSNNVDKLRFQQWVLPQSVFNQTSGNNLGELHVRFQFYPDVTLQLLVMSVFILVRFM